MKAWLSALYESILTNLKSYLKQEALKKMIVSAVLKGLALTGPAGFFAKIIVPKLIQWGIIAAKDLVQKAHDNKKLEEFEKEKNTPSKKRDELEKDILTGG